MGQLYDHWRAILGIQKFRRIVSYTGFYCFVSLLAYAYTNNTTRAGISRADQFYASYPAGTELLTDSAKVCCIKQPWQIALKRKNGDRLNSPSWPSTSSDKGSLLMLTIRNTWHTFFRMGNLMVVDS